MLITYTRAKQIIWHPAGLAGPWGAEIAREAAEKMIANAYAPAADKERARALLGGGAFGSQRVSCRDGRTLTPVCQ